MLWPGGHNVGRRIQQAGLPSPNHLKIDSDVIIFCDFHEAITLKMRDGRAATVGVG